MFRFCRSKCHRAFKKKKNPRKTRWTKSFRKTAGKELTVDATYEFEKLRHVPVRYNRELWQKTITAMKRVLEIRKRREAQHVANRLLKGVELRKAADLREVERNLDLLKAPHGKFSSLKSTLRRVALVVQLLNFVNSCLFICVQHRSGRNWSKS